MATIPRVRVTAGENSVGQTGAQSDQVMVIMGYCTGQVAGTLLSFDQVGPSKAKTDLVSGRLCQAVAEVLATPDHGQVYALVLDKTAGTNTAVTQVGTPPTGALTGTPVDDFEGKVEILSAGTLGTATFRWSVDTDKDGNHVNWSAETVTAATVALGDTGLTFTFAAGSYTTAHSYTWSSRAPTHSNTHITDGLDILIASGIDFGVGVILASPAGTLDSDRATALSSMFGAVGAKVDAIEATYKYPVFVLEAGWPVAKTVAGLATFATALKAVAPALAHDRINVAVGTCWRTSQTDGRTYRRSAIGPVAERLSSTEISVHAGEVETGRLRNVQAIDWDESAAGGLDAYRFTTLRTWPGQSGFYITRGNQFASAGTATVATHVLRIRNAAQKCVRNALIRYANKRLRTNSTTGRLTPSQAKAIELDINSQLRSVIGPHVANHTVTVDQSIDFLATGTLKGEGAFTPDGYAEDIDFAVSVKRT